jgi:hypothetical protein
VLIGFHQPIPCQQKKEWDGIFCPCCGNKLRTRPRNMKYKTKLDSGILISSKKV